MRTSLKLTLVLAGIVTVIALLAVGAAAVVRTTHENVVYPDVVYPEEEVTVTFTLSISGGTWEDIDFTGVTWSTGFIGEFYNHSNDPRASGVPANSENSYSVTITMPDTTGEYILWGWAHTKGFATDGTQNLGTFEVKQTPVVQFGGTLGWNLVGRDHEITANVRNADPSEIEEVSIYWDTVSHKDEGKDKTLYPNRTAVITYQLLTPYHFNITLPDDPAVVYIMVHGLINGRDFYDATERGISVNAEPEFEVSVPVAAFKGTNVVINWSIPTTAGIQLENTSVYWDTVSHASAIDKDNYAYRSDVLPGDDSSPYGVMLAIPDEEGTVYFVVHCIIKMHGYEFYTDAEHTIEIIPEPTITMTQYPDSAFADEDVMFVWTVSAPAGAVAETAIHWDTTSHAGVLDVTVYPQVSFWMIGEEDQTYDVTFEMPDEAGTFYFIAHALVLGEDFYVVEELSIIIRELPTVSITLTKYPGSAFVDEDVQFVWTVSAPASAVAETAIHWDITSHAGALDVSAYPQASVWMIGEEDQTYDVTFDMPDEAGTLYFIAHAIVYGKDFYVAEELSIIIRDLPTVSITTYTDEALVGEVATIEWEVTGVLETDTFGTFVHWDTTSHIDETLPSNYAEHSQSIDWDLSGSYSFQLTLPDTAGIVYLIVSADVQGMTYEDPNEVAISVKALPSVVDVTAPDKVDGGKKANVTFTLEDVDDPEKVEVLWDTESHENATDYPNTVEATDNGDGTWTVEFKVPEKDTEVFYRVHVDDDGTDVYSSEDSFKVKEKIDDSPGPGFLMAVVALSLLAVLIASVRRD